MRFRIEDHDWYKCPRCSFLFTDALMREVYEKRLAQRNLYVAEYPESEQAEILQALGNPGSCPSCGNAQVKGVSAIGPKDKRRILRKVRFLEVCEWLKRLVPAS